MTDQSIEDPTATPEAGGGAPNDPTSSGQPGANDKQDGKAPMTLAEGQALEERIRAANATHYQGVQSMIDRQSGNLKEVTATVNRYLETQKALGIEVTDEQAEQLRQAEMLRSLTAEEGGGTDGKENQPVLGADGQPVPTGEQDGMGNLAVDMMRESGVVILATDAELTLIDQETKDPMVFMSSVKLAIDTKVQRLANPDTENETETGTEGPGVNPRGKGSKTPSILPDKTPSGEATSPGDYLTAGFQQSDKFPSAEG